MFLFTRIFLFPCFNSYLQIVFPRRNRASVPITVGAVRIIGFVEIYFYGVVPEIGCFQIDVTATHIRIFSIGEIGER